MRKIDKNVSRGTAGGNQSRGTGEQENSREKKQKGFVGNISKTLALDPGSKSGTCASLRLDILFLGLRRKKRISDSRRKT